jgi:hypothetical protein
MLGSRCGARREEGLVHLHGGRQEASLAPWSNHDNDDDKFDDNDKFHDHHKYFDNQHDNDDSSTYNDHNSASDDNNDDLETERRQHG